MHVLIKNFNLLDSERIDECNGFTVMYIFFSVTNFLYQNIALVFTYEICFQYSGKLDTNGFLMKNVLNKIIRKNFP